MKIRGSVVCLPVRDLDKTWTFYQSVFELPDLKMEEGMITIELPGLSLFLMEKDAFETYSRKAGRDAQFSTDKVGAIISCALLTKNDVDRALEEAPKYGGSVAGDAAIDESYGGYVGYVFDPDGHLWELVFPPAPQA